MLFALYFVSKINEFHSYALQYLCVLPLEIMAATFTLDYWSSPIPKAVCVAVFMVSIIIINLNGVKAFGEAEFLMSVMKVVAVIGFMFVTSYRKYLSVLLIQPA